LRFWAVAFLALVPPTKTFQRHRRNGSKRRRSEFDENEAEKEGPAAVLGVVADNDTFFLEFASPETQLCSIVNCGRLLLLAADDGSIPTVILMRLLDYE
jgi:hypothetical protein